MSVLAWSCVFAYAVRWPVAAQLADHVKQASSEAGIHGQRANAGLVLTHRDHVAMRDGIEAPHELAASWPVLYDPAFGSKPVE